MNDVSRGEVVSELRRRWKLTNSPDAVRELLASSSDASLLRPVEASLTHLRIANRFASATGEGVSALVSGSSAWGAFYAVRDDEVHRSDIDVLVAADAVDDLERALSSYVSAGVVDAQQAERFNSFRELHADGKVDHFSLISSYESVPVSVDFMLWRDLDAIASLTPMREADGIRVIRELCVNPPKINGYTLDDLRTGRGSRYFPSHVRVSTGYLADTLVDAIGQHSYHLGVMGFFLGVEPHVLADGTGRLREAINRFQTNIASKIVSTSYITRHERMTPETAQKAKEAFSRDRVPYEDVLGTVI